MVAIPMHAAFLHLLEVDLLMHTISSCVLLMIERKAENCCVNINLWSC